MRWLHRLVGRDDGAAGKPSAHVADDGRAAARASGFEAIRSVTVPLALAEATQRSLRAAGREGNEGLALWSGIQDGTSFAVRTLTTPEQRALRSAEGVCVVVDGNALHEVNVAVFKRGERLLAQVHSHPGRAYHSAMDDRYAVITSPGALSLVVPDFAVRPFDVGGCAIYRLTRSGTWIEVPRQEAKSLIRVSDG